MHGVCDPELPDAGGVWMRPTWRTNSANIGAITTRIELILGRIVKLPWNQAAEKSSISITTDGGSIAADCLNYRWPLDLRIRQGQLTERGKYERMMESIDRSQHISRLLKNYFSNRLERNICCSDNFRLYKNRVF
jgi:hypothetical protein